MPVLYFDNFRGFDTTFLSLKNVNFFIGENSTGKTSLLKLIGIMSSPGFWRYRQFNTSDIDLGSFAEIVTKGKANKDFFEIGLLFDRVEAGDHLSAIKLRYIEQDNFPALKELCFVNSEINIQATIDGAFIKYRYDLNHTNEATDKKSDFFESWVKNNGLNDKQFYREEIEFVGIIPLLFQLQSLIIYNNRGNASEIKTPKYIVPPFLKNFAWFEPARSEAKKIYNTGPLSFNSRGDHSPYVLKEILPDSDVEKIINRFGYDSGLWDSIQVTTLKDKKSLSEAFEILIGIDGKKINIANVGYGVSQILPFIIEGIARPINTWFAMQQPEVHLHPRAQAAFGDFIFKCNTIDEHKFIIETHSDYIIDRYRLRVNRALQEKRPFRELSQVLFFSRNENGNKIEVIQINDDGSYSEDQPKEFRNFFITEQLNLITI